MPRDPYAVLDVAPDASEEAISWAYRRRLNEASRLGAWKEAQEIDAAYTALRDPVRRQMLDQHGLVAPSGRVPASAPHVPVQVPSARAWTTPPPLPPVTIPSVPRAAVPPPPPAPPAASLPGVVRPAAAAVVRPSAAPAGRDRRLVVAALVVGLVVGAGADHVLVHASSAAPPPSPAAVTGTTGNATPH